MSKNKKNNKQVINQNPQSLKIVIAEDESIIRMDLQQTLEALGHKVIGEATNGEEAINLVIKHQPDLAIFDIKMPVLDGLQAAEKLQSELVCPIILLTAYGQKEFIEKAGQSGVYAYLIKPFKEEQILAAIQIAIKRFKEEKKLHNEINSLKENLETRKIVEQAKGILMEKNNLSEKDAYRHLQKQAMDKRCSLKEISQAVILLFGEKSK